MIRYVKHHFIDREKFDHCVRMDGLGLMYGFSWYLDAVCENWDALVLNDYDAVWPLPVRRKYGFSYFYRPFAVQQLGIFSKKEVTPALCGRFVKAMTAHCSFADLYLNEGQQFDQKLFSKIKVTFNTNMLVDLGSSYRGVYNAFKSNTRRNIKKAGENNLQLFEHDSPATLVRIFKEERQSELQLPVEFYRNMEKAMYKALHNGSGKVWTVYGGPNSVVAGAFILESEKRHVFLFSALTPLGRELKAMFYLINEYLIYESAHNKTFDFEGSNNPGLARFYQGFGAQKVNYWNLRYNGLPWPLRWLKRK